MDFFVLAVACSRQDCIMSHHGGSTLLLLIDGSRNTFVSPIFFSGLSMDKQSHCDQLIRVIKWGTRSIAQMASCGLRSCLYGGVDSDTGLLGGHEGHDYKAVSIAGTEDLTDTFAILFRVRYQSNPTNYK